MNNRALDFERTALAGCTATALFRGILDRARSTAGAVLNTAAVVETRTVLSAVFRVLTGAVLITCSIDHTRAVSSSDRARDAGNAEC